jgi:hypothetical protein
MSAMYELEIGFKAEDGNDDPARFEEFLDAVVDAFLERGFDVDYSAVASALQASFTVEVEDSSESALISALTALSEALSAVTGGLTDRGSHEVLSTRKLAMA